MVGIGKLAKNGILIKGGETIELLPQIRQFVFDKTGTLTTGKFAVQNIEYYTPDKEKTLQIAVDMEKHSSHPIAKAIVTELGGGDYVTNNLKWQKIEERPGRGVWGVLADGTKYRLTSAKEIDKISNNGTHDVYLLENDHIIMTIDIADAIKQQSEDVIRYLHNSGNTSILLSGDSTKKVEMVAEALNISEYYAQQTPQEKLEKIGALSAIAPTAMIGDGVNDAPALARADLGVSLSGASQAAVESAQVVLLNGNIKQLPKAIAISKATLKTIRQNLFWAFGYNIIAIPIAALGLLNPMWAALFMAFSDVVVVGNALRLQRWRENAPTNEK